MGTRPGGVDLAVRTRPSVRVRTAIASCRAGRDAPRAPEESRPAQIVDTERGFFPGSCAIGVVPYQGLLEIARDTGAGGGEPGNI